MAAALIDRLLHHCHIVNIRGSSYRMRKHIDLSKILHSPPAEPSPLPPQEKESKSKGEVDQLEARHLRQVCNFRWPDLCSFRWPLTPGVADDGLPSVLRIVECSRIRAIGWIAITNRTEPNPGRQTDAAVSSSSRSRMSAPPRGPAEAAETARHEERGHGRTYRIEDRSTWQWQARGGLERLRSTRPSDAI